MISCDRSGWMQKHMNTLLQCFLPSALSQLSQRGIVCAWLSVQQAAPSNASRAPIPQGATRIVRLQLHGSEKYDLKILASNLPQGLPSPQSSQAGPSPSPPGRTSTSCQPWLLLSGESWSCTALEERTCQTSSPLLCQSQPKCSGPWKCPISWAQLQWPTHQEDLPSSWPFDPSWPSWQPSWPSSQGPWCWKDHQKEWRRVNTSSLSQIPAFRHGSSEYAWVIAQKVSWMIREWLVWISTKFYRGGRSLSLV